MKMRAQSILLILIVIFGTFAPLSVTCSSLDDQTYIVALDVCHASGSILSANTDMPVIHECPCKVFALHVAGLQDNSSQKSNSYLSAFQQERPPEA